MNLTKVILPFMLALPACQTTPPPTLDAFYEQSFQEELEKSPQLTRVKCQTMPQLYT